MCGSPCREHKLTPAPLYGPVLGLWTWSLPQGQRSVESGSTGNFKRHGMHGIIHQKPAAGAPGAPCQEGRSQSGSAATSVFQTLSGPPGTWQQGFPYLHASWPPSLLPGKAATSFLRASGCDSPSSLSSPEAILLGKGPGQSLSLLLSMGCALGGGRLWKLGG